MVQYRSTRSDVSPAVLAAVHAALLAVSVAILVATLAPFQVRAPSWARLVNVALVLRWQDIALNLALFAPAGFLVGMRERMLGRPAWSLVRAASFGALISAAIELLQAFVPVRITSPIDVAANAAGFGAGALLHARVACRAERALLAFVGRKIGFTGIALCAALLAALALAPLHAQALHDSFHWTVGPTPMSRGPRAIVIGMLSSLGLAGWLGYALRSHARSARVACAGALPVVAVIEVCRGYSGPHVASLFTFALAVLCALVSAHASGRVQSAALQRSSRLWV